jgi:hypothetical protein
VPAAVLLLLLGGMRGVRRRDTGGAAACAVTTLLFGVGWGVEMVAATVAAASDADESGAVVLGVRVRRAGGFVGWAEDGPRGLGGAANRLVVSMTCDQKIRRTAKRSAEQSKKISQGLVVCLHTVLGFVTWRRQDEGGGDTFCSTDVHMSYE